MRGLEGRLVMVTGSSGLVGSALVQRFVQEHARVIAACRTPAGGNSPAVSCVPIDLANSGSIHAAFDAMERGPGIPSVLIANASSREALGKTFDEVGTDDFADLLRVDVAGHFACAREMVRRRRAGQAISIVLVSSIYATQGVDAAIYEPGEEGTPVQYATVKSAMSGLARFLAARWGRQGVRINVLVSGGVRSTERQTEAFVERYARKTMLGRMATADEIAAAAAFLASDDASYITGAVLHADGGWSAW